MKKENKNNKISAADKKQIQRNLQEPYVFPKNLLNQIRENTRDGFFLCTTDEKGGLVINFHADSDTAVVALVEHIFRWSKAMKMSQENCLQQHLLGGMIAEEHGEELGENA